MSSFAYDGTCVTSYDGTALSFGPWSHHGTHRRVVCMWLILRITIVAATAETTVSTRDAVPARAIPRSDPTVASIHIRNRRTTTSNARAPIQATHHTEVRVGVLNRRRSSLYTGVFGSLASQTSSTICFGYQRFGPGQNQLASTQPWLRRWSAWQNTSELTRARHNQMTKTTAAATEMITFGIAVTLAIASARFRSASSTFGIPPR